MPTKNCIMIDQQHRVWVRTVTDRQIDLESVLLPRLLKQQTILFPPLFTVNYLGKTVPVTLTARGPGEGYVTIELPALQLHSTYLMSGSVLVPTFGAGGDRMQPVWVNQWPDKFRIALLGHFIHQPKTEGVGHPYWYLNMVWLFAFDTKDNSTWRLPLANLYDDCRVCTGNDTPTEGVLSVCIQKALALFSASFWGGDFYKTPTESPRFFRFKAKKDQFETQPFLGDRWQDLCRKVAVGISREVRL